MRTVLFVDDEQSIRNAIERMYLERDDVRCLFAASGLETEHIPIEFLRPIAEEVHTNG